MSGETTTTGVWHGKPQPRGLVVKNIGGRAGWFFRRLFPVLSTQAYLRFIRLTRKKAARRRIDAFRAAGGTWFSQVEIETINRCNGTCAFCPINSRIDPRPFHRMADALFSNIVCQLAGIGFSGHLNLYSNNEPFLDKRLPDLAREARAALPGAFLNCSTNGGLLDLESFRRIMPHLDCLVVNNYNSGPVLHDNVRELREFCLSGEGAALLEGKTLQISLRSGSDVLTNRAGASPNRKALDKPLAIPCPLPFTQFVVRPDGKASLCCNDALGRMTLGDLAAQTLAEIWFGSAYEAVRRKMDREGRGGIPLCGGCDFVKHEVH